MKLEFSFDDGDVLDLKVAELLEKYGFRGTFYIPSLSNGATRRSLTNGQVRKLAERHEIGGHTVSHPKDMKVLTDEELAYEIGKNKLTLEKVIGKPITKFCYPRGRYDDRVVNAVKSFLYESARTTDVLDTVMPSDPFRTATSVHVYSRKEYGNNSWLEVGRNMFNAALVKGNKGRFHLWGHSWEIEKFHQWDLFEGFLEWLQRAYREQLPIA